MPDALCMKTLMICVAFCRFNIITEHEFESIKENVHNQVETAFQYPSLPWIIFIIVLNELCLPEEN